MKGPAFSLRPTRSDTSITSTMNNQLMDFKRILSEQTGSAGFAGLATGFLLGILIRPFMRMVRGKSNLPLIDSDDEMDLEDDISTNTREEHKLVLCVRTDLKMQKGKIGAQCGHATLGAYKSAQRKNPNALRVWEACGQPKIAVQINSMNQARDLERKAKALKLTTSMVLDAGRTQIAAVS